MPVKGESKCRTWLLRVKQTFVPRTLDFEEFERGKALFVAFQKSKTTLEGGVSGPLSREHKLGFLVAVLENFLDQSLILNSQDLQKLHRSLSKEVKISKGKLGYSETKAIFHHLIQKFGVSPQGDKNRLLEFLMEGYGTEVRARIERVLIDSPDFQPYLSDLVAAGLTKNPSWSEKLSDKIRHPSFLIPALRSLVINILLFYIGIPIPHAPEVFLMNDAPVSSVELKLAREEGIEVSAKLATARLLTWRTVHRSYLCLRKLYLSTLLVFGVSYLAFHPEIVSAGIHGIQTGFRMNTMTRQELRDYERSTYHSREVVEEQLKSWLEAQEQPPTSENIEKMRQMLEKQEQEGVFRIYKDP